MKKEALSKRKKRLATALMVAPMVATSIPVADLTGLSEVGKAEAAGVFAGGDGTAANPYLIASASQLNDIRNNLSSHFKLTANINLSGIEWQPINGFTGAFDGNGYEIHNLTINSKENYSGLFSQTGAIIKNLGLVNPNVKSSGYYTGSLAGKLTGNVENVYVRGGRIEGVTFVGGIAGDYYGWQKSMKRVYSTAEVTGTDTGAGGLVGTHTSGTIKDAYSTGKTTGKQQVGGLVGSLNASGVTNLENAFATGAVEGTSQVGGVVGYNSYGTLKSVFALNPSVKGTTVVGKGIGKVVEQTSQDVSILDKMGGNGAVNYETQLIEEEKVTDSQSYSGFDFTNVWEPGKNDLPQLRFKNNPDLIKPKYEKKITVVIHDGKLYNPVYDAEDLKIIRENNPYVLLNDINLSEIEWQPIKDFSGIFNGNGFEIHNLTINSKEHYSGLFGQTGATIKNLGLVNPNVKSSGYYTGSLAGKLTGNVENVYVRGGRIEGVAFVGGIAGDYYGWQKSMKRVYSTAEVTASDAGAGGLVGTHTSGTIKDAYSTGKITGKQQVGGLVGNLNASGPTIVENAITAGIVEGTNQVGGIVGYSRYGTLKSVFALNPSVKGTTAVGKGIGGAEGTDVKSMYSYNGMEGSGNNNQISGEISKEQSLSKTSYISDGSFDFMDSENSPVWGIDEGKTLPYLLFSPSKIVYNPETGTWISENKPPESTAVPDQTLEIGTNAVIDLSQYFSDPDGDDLSYSVELSDDTVASYVISNGQLTLTPLKEGQTTLTVTAADGKGGTTTQEIKLSVKKKETYVDVTFHWLPVKNAVSFKINRNGSLLGEVSGNQTSYTDHTAKLGETYRYRAVPVYEDGSEGEPIEIEDIVVETDKPIDVPAPEPENPTDPTDPENPTDPSPVDPTDPENPTEPNPTDPENPTEPNPTDPTDPENPTDPEPTDPENPTDPNPVDPTDPENPTEPSPTDPTDPEKPADPKPSIPPIIGEDFITLEWYAIDGAAYYEIHQDGQKVHTQKENGTDFYSHTLEGLKKGAKYHFEIIPFAADGTEMDDDAIEVGDVEVHPAMDLITKVTGNEVAVEWSSHPKAAAYLVTVKDMKGQVVEETQVKPAETSFFLANAGQYRVQVQPLDDKGEKMAGASTVFNIEKDFIATPPRDLKAEEVTTDHVTLSWTGKENVTYIVERDGQEVARTKETIWTDKRVKDGTTYTYSVKAVEHGHESEPVTLAVSVPEKNQSPTAGMIRPQKTVRGVTLAMNLHEYFSDPDGDPLTYQVTMEKNELAGFALTDGQLVFTPHQVGSSKVTVRAEDGRGGFVEKTFMFEVENQAPTASVLPAMTLKEGTQEKTLDLSSHFKDADGDELTFTLEGASTEAYEAKVDGTTLKVTPNAPGTGKVTVTAADAYGGKVSRTLAVTVEADLPEAPTGLKAETTHQNAVLTWKASPSEVEGYIIKRNGKEIARTKETAYTDNGLASDTLYSYEVTAYTAKGRESAPAKVTAKTTAAGMANVKAVYENGKMSVSWSAYEKGGEPASLYKVQRYIRLEDGTFKADGASQNVKDTSFQDTKAVTEGAVYRYEVTPRIGTKTLFEAAGTSNEVQVPKQTGGGQEEEATVQNVQAKAQDGKVLLTFDALTMKGETPSLYLIKRYVKQDDGSFRKESTQYQTSSTSYEDTRVQEGATYQYEVIPRFGTKTVFEAAGFSNEVTLAAKDAPETGGTMEEELVNEDVGGLIIHMNGTEAELSWPAVEGADRYRVGAYVKGEDGKWKPLTYPQNAIGTSTTFKGLPENTEVKFMVSPRINYVYDYTQRVDGSEQSGELPKPPEKEPEAPVETVTPAAVTATVTKDGQYV
ncbi:fibronectin type III domain-containing protein, partial [Pseudobacillus badius]|uniref:fibronectin type III domain-containing protein n=1 Tax=Bacillus badius TaxID=1455 RepID=UPI003D3575CF